VLQLPRNCEIQKGTDAQFIFWRAHLALKIHLQVLRDGLAAGEQREIHRDENPTELELYF